MVKTLVPLLLLVLIVFATLFFPLSLTKERTTIPVTGILTSARVRRRGPGHDRGLRLDVRDQVVKALRRFAGLTRRGALAKAAE